MSTGAESAKLRHLAHLYGVQTSFTDALKRRITTPADSLLAVLRGLGAPVERIGDAENALHAREDELWHWRLEPVQLAWDGWLEEIALRLPLSDANGDVEIDLALENGGGQSWVVALSEASVRQERRLGQKEYVELKLPIEASLPAGYHDLTLRTAGRGMRSLVISAPVKTYSAPAGRYWGVFLPLYALHSRRSQGIGDLTDLGSFVDWASNQGATFVGTLPLLASFLEELFEPSPYAPVSRVFWNEIFIDLDRAVTELEGGMPEYHTVPAASAQGARRLNARETVPFREVMALKRRVLTQLTRRPTQDPAVNEAGHSNLGARPALRDYATFRAATEKLGPSWRGWPERQRSGSLTAGDYESETADYFALAQSFAQAQMQDLEALSHERDVRLYLDLPVGVHPDGYDAWRYQRLFVNGMSVGTPPDLFARDGQNWSFQPLNPDEQRRHGYEYVRAYLGHHMQAAGLLRIDHAIGLHRLYWIPEGARGRDGVFVRQPAEELYAILSLESHRHQSAVVGENLGLVPESVDRGMARHGVGHMYVQSFELTGKSRQPLNPPPRNSIASFGTHDLAPFASFWTDQDLEERQRMGIMSPAVASRMRRERRKGKRALASHLRKRGLMGDEDSTKDAYLGTTRLLAESQAKWAMLNLEEAWGDPRPQNVPGTTAEQHPNWVRRSRYSLEEFNEVDDLAETLTLMRNVRGRHGKEKQSGR